MPITFKSLITVIFFFLVTPAFAESETEKCFLLFNANQYQQSIKQCAKAAEQGDAWAQRMLGEMYYFGEGAPKDLKKAVHWFTRAAEQGNANAQSSLGSSYYNGDGVPKDLKKAIHWYGKAAEQGNARAQFALGSVYYSGTGAPKDYTQAYAWANVAAAQGDKDAAEFRERLEKEMTASQIEQAQALSNEYYAKYVKKKVDSNGAV